MACEGKKKNKKISKSYTNDNMMHERKDNFPCDWNDADVGNEKHAGNFKFLKFIII